MSREQSSPVINLPFKYIDGLVVSNDATTPDTLINISAGRARDSDDIMDITVGIANENLIGNTVAAPLVINSALSGVGGLDAGTIVVNRLYAVYVIASSHYFKPVVGLISLASNALPNLPFNYDSFRLIGYVATDASADFILGFMSLNGANRRWDYADVSAQTVLSAGASAAFANVIVSNFVPNKENVITRLETDFVANAADDTLELTKFGIATTMVTQRAAVAGATANTVGQAEVLAGLDAGTATVDYKVSAGSVNIFVSGYEFSV